MSHRSMHLLTSLFQTVYGLAITFLQMDADQFRAPDFEFFLFVPDSTEAEAWKYN